MDQRDIYQQFARQRELRAESDRRHLVWITMGQPRRSQRTTGLYRLPRVVAQRLYALYRGLYNQRVDLKPVEKPPVLKSRPR